MRARSLPRDAGVVGPEGMTPQAQLSFALRVPVNNLPVNHSCRSDAHSYRGRSPERAILERPCSIDRGALLILGPDGMQVEIETVEDGPILPHDADTDRGRRGQPEP